MADAEFVQCTKDAGPAHSRFVQQEILFSSLASATQAIAEVRWSNMNEFKCVVVFTICFHLLLNLNFFAFLTTLVFHYGVCRDKYVFIKERRQDLVSINLKNSLVRKIGVLISLLSVRVVS